MTTWGHDGVRVSMGSRQRTGEAPFRFEEMELVVELLDAMCTSTPRSNLLCFVPANWARNKLTNKPR